MAADGPTGTRPPARGKGWRDRDLTRDSLVKSLLVLAVPMMGSSLLGGVVFQLVDLTFLSWLGEGPMAAVIIVNQTLRQMTMMLTMGLGFAAQALIARAVGEGDVGRAEHLAGQVLLLGGCLWLLLALAGLGLAEPLFSMAGPDPSFYQWGVPYLQLVLMLSIGMIGAQSFYAILGGAGDTTTPLAVTAVQIAVAIFAEWVLVFGKLGMPALGVRGIVLGILCGQLAAIALGARVLFGGRARVHLRRRHLRPDPVAIRQILRLSWPPAVQLGINVAMILVFLRLAGRFGQSVQAAYAIGLRLGMIVPMVCFPLAGACATLVGQALGAGDTRRAWRAVGVGLLAHGTVMWSFAIVVFFFRSEIMDLFSNDPEVIAIGAEYLLYASGAFVMWAFFFPFMRALQGAGDMVAPMVITLCTTFFVSIPLAVLLSTRTELGREGLWIAFLVSSVVSTLGTGLRLASGRWTRRAAAVAAP